MVGMMNEGALKMIAEGAKKLAGEQLKGGMRKGISLDGQEITIVVKPVEAETPETESPMRKRFKELGVEVE